MKYRVVEDYYRQSHFDFFRQLDTPFYHLTFPLEITRLKALVDEKGYSTYINLCYFFIKGILPIEDFRYRVLDGRIVLYDEIHMGITVPTAGGRFSFRYLDYDPDWERFNRTAKADPTDEVSLETKKHRNYVYFTAAPTIAFTGLTHPVSAIKTDAEPKVCFGKFYRQGDSLMVPVGMQVNHIFIDGLHMSELVERVQALYNEPS